MPLPTQLESLVGYPNAARNARFVNPTKITSPMLIESTRLPRRFPSLHRLLAASIPSPKTLVAHLDQFVIGQDIAKRRLALGISNHYKRLVDTWDRTAPDPIITDPDSHSTNREVQYSADRSFRQGQDPPGQIPGFLSERPLVIGDATSLTEPGYVGDDEESLLSRLIQAANGDVEVAQQGIVFIDEIDQVKKPPAQVSRTFGLASSTPFPKCSKASLPRCHRKAGGSIRLRSASPLIPAKSCLSAAMLSWGWKRSSPSGTGGVGSYRQMGYCGK